MNVDFVPTLSGLHRDSEKRNAQKTGEHLRRKHPNGCGGIMSSLSCENINFGYDEREILQNISLSISNGERIALMGSNGSGKTTLSLILTGILEPRYGEIKCDGVSPFDDENNFDFRRRIGYVFQNPEDGFVASDVVREIAFGAENFAVPSDEIRSRVDELLEHFGLIPWASKSPLTLSGGMKARLAIVSALATGADFIMLDEPESFLDWHGQNLLAQSMDEIRESAGIIHITQSPEFAKMCDRIYRIENGKIERIEPAEVIDYIFPTSFESNIADDKIIELENISFAYEDKTVLNKISLSVNRGEFLGIVGESGAGKSTLALCVANLIKPACGKIELNGRVSIVFQFPERQLFAETVLDDVMFGPKNLGLNNPDILAKDALKLVDVREYLWNRSPFDLSDGQQRRVGFAGVLATRPEILILDEPFASLDFAGMDNLFHLLEELASKQTTVIIITHRTDLLEKISPRTIAIKDGSIVFDGDTETLLQNAKLCDKIGLRNTKNSVLSTV